MWTKGTKSLYLLPSDEVVVGLLVNEVLYYKGKYRVKAVTESLGYLVVETLEEFDDYANGEKVKVAVGERRIVPRDTVHKRKSLTPPAKEHSYELQMERKLERLVDKEEKKQNSEKT